MSYEPERETKESLLSFWFRAKGSPAKPTVPISESRILKLECNHITAPAIKIKQFYTRAVSIRWMIRFLKSSPIAAADLGNSDWSVSPGNVLISRK